MNADARIAQRAKDLVLVPERLEHVATEQQKQELLSLITHQGSIS